MAYLLQHLLTDSAARAAGSAGGSRGRPVSDLRRTGQAEQPGRPRTPRPRRGAGRSRGDPRRQVGRLGRGHIRGAEGRGMLCPARRECHPPGGCPPSCATVASPWSWPTMERAPGAAAMADSVPQLAQRDSRGPALGARGRRNSRTLRPRAWPSCTGTRCWQNRTGRLPETRRLRPTWPTSCTRQDRLAPRKGVMISHRNSLTFVAWAAASAGLGEGDRVCSPAPAAFRPVGL